MTWLFEAFLDEEAFVPTPRQMKEALAGRPGLLITRATVRFLVEEEALTPATAQGIEVITRAFPHIRLEEISVRAESVA